MRSCIPSIAPVFLPALLGSLGLTPEVRAQSPPVTLVKLDPSAVRPVLEKLWDESVEQNRELVACLSGQREGASFEIDRAVPLESLADVPDSLEVVPDSLEVVPDSLEDNSEFGSDSVSVGSRLTDLSIATCRPPEWVGTIHTHSSRVLELRYPKLSSFDRTVVSFWHRRWRHESVFCVLFDRDKPPYCEWQAGA
jgi:hypothetical protein